MTTPIGIDLDQYKNQAKDLLKHARAAQSDAIGRIRASHPEQLSRIASGKLRLADAQLVLARENGFPSWTKFKDYILFRQAVEALDSGDIPRLAALVDDRPTLLKYRCNTGEWYEVGYFSSATLLHHVAGNPIRRPLPANAVDIARLLLQKGADPNAMCGDDLQWSTVGLIITGKQASEAGLSMQLIDVLVEHGGSNADILKSDVLRMPLWNGAPETARALADRGATVELRHAAGMGDTERVRALIVTGTTRDELELALVYTAVRNQFDCAKLLIDAGATGDKLVDLGSGLITRTALHEAANRGHRQIVEMLLANGADPSIREPHWNGAPSDWAEHGGHTDLATMLER